MLAAVFAPAFARSKDEPVAHVGDLGRPAPIGFSGAFAAPEALDDALDLQELGFRILRVFRPRDRAFGAGSQLAVEVAHFHVGRRLRLQRDEAAGVVVDLRQRFVDVRDALLDRFALPVQLRLEVGHLADRVFVQQLLEAGHEARQIVGVQLVQHRAEFGAGGDAGIHLLRVELERLFVFGHCTHDLFAQAGELLVFGIDLLLQPAAHLLLTVVAGFQAERLFAEGLFAQAVDRLEMACVQGMRRVVQDRLGLLAQAQGLLLLELGSRLLGLLGSELFCGFGQRGFQRGQVGGQGLQQVGRAFQPVLLVLQRGHFARAALPVEFGEVAVLLELVQGLQTIARGLLLLLQRRDALAGFSQARLQHPRLGFERRDLGFVAPAQHVTAAVVDAVAIVFFVPLAGGLDLPGAGDGAGFAAELVLAGAAGHVEAVRQLALEPGVERRIGLDDEFSRQRIGVQGGPVAASVLAGFVRRRAHAKVHQPALQMRAVHPFADARVVLVGHQKAQRKSVQQPLGSALPIALIVTHLDQLAGIGHVGFAQAQRLAQ